MIVNIIVLAFLLTTAVYISRITILFGAVMIYGIYSLLCATMFVVLDAVDVAFTEAAVGTGISTILMLSALSLTGSRIEITHKRKPIMALCASLGLGAALLWGTSDMPHFADASAPANLHVAPYYLEESSEQIGIPNVVTSVLASYRGYDTLGEVVVIFTAGIGVISLLGRTTRRRED